jgi:hypothetical protein
MAILLLVLGLQSALNLVHLHVLERSLVETFLAIIKEVERQSALGIIVAVRKVS